MPETVNGRPDGSDGDGMTLSRRELLAGAGGVLLAGGLAACGGSSSSSSASQSTTTPAGSLKHGGNFRLAMTGGGASDIIDGQSIVNKPDQARLAAGWETLRYFDENYKLQNLLAEEVTQDKPDQWTIRIRSGIEFHNGKTLSADDVVYSFHRILDPKAKLFGAAGLASVQNIKKMDAQTVRLELSGADSTIDEQLGQYYNAIVPDGYSRTNELKWVGTGAFKVKSFHPGEQSIHIKNTNYWQTGQPYFEQLTITDFPNPTAQVNALLSGAADAMTDVPFAQVQTVKSHAGAAVLISQGAGWLPLCMAIDMAPFTDNRVRQAMRLLVDREAMVAQVLSGYGRVANDLYSPFDPCYDTSLPQRQHDPEKAVSLLKAAGVFGQTIDLHTTNGAAGMVDSANVFAAQAKSAGVNINVHNDPNYYSPNYLKLAFSVDFWGTRNYLSQVANGSLPAGPPYNCPYNECHWPPKTGPGSNYLSLYKQAKGTIDPGKRCELIHEMQQIEYNYGGYVIPFFNNLVDGYSTKVVGLQPSRSTLNLDSFGHGFRTIAFA
jgi:peptide/nickel transport system substrate-binding protein